MKNEDFIGFCKTALENLEYQLQEHLKRNGEETTSNKLVASQFRQEINNFKEIIERHSDTRMRVNEKRKY